MKNWKQKFLLGNMIFLILVYLASSTWAEQGEQDVVKGKAQEEYELETITVTAQKREENIQEVPASITALSEIQIEDAGIKDIEDLKYYTPNLHIQKMGNHAEQYLSIRGMFNKISPTVGVFVDGVSYSENLAYDPDLYDIERIEVLKGPQGTLFGRNTEAGAIRIITKKPGNIWEGKASAGYGDYDSQDYSATIRGPLIKDRLFFGISGKRYLSDGYYENDYLGTDEVEDMDDTSGRARLRWTPTDAWDIMLSVNADRYDDGYGGYAPLEEMRHHTHHVNLDYEGDVENDLNGQSLSLDYEGDWFRFTSITAHRDADYDMAFDMDFTQFDMMISYFDLDHDQWSQEVRLASPKDSGPFKWLIGGYYFDEDMDTDCTHDWRQGYPVWGIPPYMTTQKSEVDTENYAFFSQATYTLWEKLGLTAGFRYDHDKKEFNGTQFDTPDVMGAGVATVKTDKTFSEWLPKFAIDYRFTPDFMGYASISKGYTSGGFNAFSTSVLGVPYDAEYSWNYEVGVKSSWLDNRLILNLAAFYIDWKDKQVATSIAPMTVILENAAECTSMGFEVEAMARPATGLELTAGFGYTNIEFDDFKDAIFDQDPASPTYGQKIGEIDYSDKKNIFAPEYTYNLAVQYRYPLSNSKTLFSRLELQGTGDFYYDYDNEIKESNYEIVNARLGYEGEYKGHGLELYLWAKNIFDEEYATSVWGSETMGWFGRAGDPQTFGVTLTGRF
jgi:iron complex outermembrane receptor protein